MQWLVVLLMTALLLAPGNGIAQQSQDTSTAPAKTYSLKERQAYQQQVAEDLAKLQNRVSDLEGQYLKAKQQVRRMLLKNVHSLKLQLYDAQKQLAALKKASPKDWGRLKAQMDKKLMELTQACQQAESLPQ
jgi:hypothetical protein